MSDHLVMGRGLCRWSPKFMADSSVTDSWPLFPCYPCKEPLNENLIQKYSFFMSCRFKCRSFIHKKNRPVSGLLGVIVLPLRMHHVDQIL